MSAERPEENATTWRLRLWLENDEGMYADVTQMVKDSFKDAIRDCDDWQERRQDWELGVRSKLEEYCKEVLLRNLDLFQIEMMGCALTWGVDFESVASDFCDNFQDELEDAYAGELHPEGYVDWYTGVKVAGSYRAESWMDIWHVDCNIRETVNLADPMCIRAIKTEFNAMASSHRGNHAATRVSQRPTLVAINVTARTVRIQESAMLHD